MGPDRHGHPLIRVSSVRTSPASGKLRRRWQAPEGVMTAAMVQALRRYKADVMAALEDWPAGPGLGRDHVGAVTADLKRLHRLFGDDDAGAASVKGRGLSRA